MYAINLTVLMSEVHNYLAGKSATHFSRWSPYSSCSTDHCAHLDHAIKTALDLATIGGACACYLHFPFQSIARFTLYKATFYDAIALHYG